MSTETIDALLEARLAGIERQLAEQGLLITGLPGPEDSAGAPNPFFIGPEGGTLVDGDQFWVDIRDHGAVAGQDCTAAIEAAQQEAEELPGKYGIFIPRGTWLYSQTLLQRVPWIGIPGKSTLKRTSVFTYTGLQEQFSILNAHASTTYNPATADTVVIKDIDFEIEGTAEPGKGSIGLANVAGGEIWNCQFKTNGKNVVGAFIDVYACVKNFRIDAQGENLTEAATGGNVWIRNLAAKPEEAGQTTENIYVSPRSRFLTTTGDEALAVYGVFGMTKKVLIDGATLIGGKSTVARQRLGSTFPSSNGGERVHAAVEDVEWRKCTFIDVEGNLKANGEVLGFGRGTDATNTCQNIKHVDCTFIVRTEASKVVASRNQACKYEGGTAGIKAINPYVNAVGSPEPLSAAMLEYPTVVGGTTVGNILSACKRCTSVTAGSWEATEKVFFDCSSVGGDYRFTIPNTTGIAFYREANEGTWSGIASYGKGEGTGGRALLVVHNTVGASNTITLDGATIATTAEAGNVIETPTEGSIPTINLRKITTTGPTELARKGKFAQADGNSWYGKLETKSGTLTAVGEAFTTGEVETQWDLTVCAGGGGGAGGGSAAKEGAPIATQVGGAGAGAGQAIKKLVTLLAKTTYTAEALGAGGKPGKPGAASSNNEGHAGEAGGNGGDTTLKGTGLTITAKGGKGGGPSLANSAANVNGGSYAQQGGLTSGTTAAPVGWGGVANSATGFAGGQAGGSIPRGGGAGAPASLTEGGVAGGSNSVSTKTGTRNGGTPAAAPANSGQGGDGGGGGAPEGAGGEGGEGGSGYISFVKVG